MRGFKKKKKEALPLSVVQFLFYKLSCSLNVLLLSVEVVTDLQSTDLFLKHSAFDLFAQV